MEGFKGFGYIIAIFTIVSTISVMPVYGQISTPCTTSMLNSFTPCLNFITQSSGNGSSPTADCCGSVKSFLGGGMDCACLIIFGNVPLQLPINRTLAISLPRACNMSGTPFQCKATGTPLPAPGPVSFGPAPSPSGLSPSASPKASSISESASPASAPKPDTTLATPASPPVNPEFPTTIPARRPVLTPSSAAKFSHISLPSVLLFGFGIMVLKYY